MCKCEGLETEALEKWLSGEGGFLKDVRTEFLPSLLPRIKAALFVVLLIGSIALVVILGAAFFGPGLIHGNNVLHANGKIFKITGPDRNFVLVTPAGRQLYFQCGTQCRASLGHLQRHDLEKANTDVYYILGPNASLMALDVD